MYRFFILLLFASISMPVFSVTRTVVTQTPVYNPYYGAYYGGDYMPQRRYRYGRQTASMFPDINDLERYAMNKNFLRENDRSRLERLETLAFGSIQDGDYRTRYNNVRNAILSRPKQNCKTSILRSIGNYFGGQLTGFTPPITSYPDDYSSDYGKSSSTEYITPWGKGYETTNYGIGSGMGVHLLD